MSDLISRGEAIEALKLVLSSSFGSDEFDYGTSCQFMKDVEVLKNLPSAQQWIPFSEKLPEITGTYLVTKRSNAYPVSEAVYIASSECWTDTYAGKRYRDGYILAWMPLPEPYEVEE